MQKQRKIEPAPIIEGEYIRLREITPNDTEFIIKWRNDKEVGKYISFTFEKLTKEVHQKYLERYFKEKSAYYYIAEEIETKERIGAISLYDIDMLAKKAEIGKVFVLPKFGLYAYEVTFLLLKFAFETLTLNKIYGIQQESNPAVDFFLSLGCKKEGILKEHYWDGQKADNIIMLAVFKHEFENIIGKINMKLT